jgi:hypothetical protein
MVRCKRLIALSLVTLSAGGLAQRAHPQSLDAQGRALDLITSTADRICSIVKLAGNSQSLKVKGDVKAQLSGLIKTLADVGISGAADFSTDEYEGLLQGDLATAVAHNEECKLKVFDKLQEKMIK